MPEISPKPCVSCEVESRQSTPLSTPPSSPASHGRQPHSSVLSSPSTSPPPHEEQVSTRTASSDLRDSPIMRELIPSPTISRDVGSPTSSHLSPAPPSDLSIASLSDTSFCSSPLTLPSPYEGQCATRTSSSAQRPSPIHTDTAGGSADGRDAPQPNTEVTRLKQKILQLEAELASHGGETSLRVEHERRRWRDECTRAAIASQEKIDKLQRAIAERDAALACARTESDQWKAKCETLQQTILKSQQTKGSVVKSRDTSRNGLEKLPTPQTVASGIPNSLSEHHHAPLQPLGTSHHLTTATDSSQTLIADKSEGIKLYDSSAYAHHVSLLQLHKASEAAASFGNASYQSINAFEDRNGPSERRRSMPVQQYPHQLSGPSQASETVSQAIGALDSAKRRTDIVLSQDASPSVADAMKQELEDAKKVAATLTTENARLKWEIDRWTWEIRGTTAELRRLREQATSQDRTITTLYQENQRLRSEFDICRDQICRERGTMSVAARDLDNAQLHVTSLQKDVEGLRACLDSALDHNDQLKEEVHSLQARVKEHEADPSRWSSTWPRERPSDSQSTMPRFHPYRQEPAATSSFSLSAERGSSSYAEASRRPSVIDPALDAFQPRESCGLTLPAAGEQSSQVNDATNIAGWNSGW